jgi:hypothetical protein
MTEMLPGPLVAARKPWNPDQHPRDPLTGRFIGKGLVPRKSGGPAKSGAIPRRPDTPTTPSVPGPSPKGAPSPPVPAPVPAPTAKVSRLDEAVRSGVKSRKPLSSGGTGEVELVTFNDGTLAIHKTSHAPDDANAKREVDAAQLAASVAAAVGVSTPAIHRINDREIYMDYLNSPTAYDDPRMDATTIAELADSPAGRRLGLFDLLIDYDDRDNRENWALHDGALTALDHDTAWEAGRDPKKPPQEKWAQSPFTAHFAAGKKWKSNDLSPAEIEDVRARLDGLGPEFARLGHQDWLAFAQARLDAIAAHASGAVTASVEAGGSMMASAAQADVPEPLVAAAEVHTGAMVALIPTDADAARLAVDGGEPVDQLHCTLLYLGEAAAIPDEARAAIIDAVRAYVDGWPPVEADGFAVSLFNPGDAVQSDGKQRDTCVVLGLSGDDVDIVHDMVAEAVGEVEADPGGFTMAEQHAPWVAHVTLTYTSDPGQILTLVDRVGPVTFDRVRVVFAGDATDIPLDGSPPPGEDGSEEDAAALAASFAEFQSRMPAHLQRYWIRRIAPWGHGSFKRCVRQIRPHYPQDPEGTCANLHHEATGTWPGRHGSKNHDGTGATIDAVVLSEGDMTMASPTMPMPAVKPDQTPDGICPDGQHLDPGTGECLPDEADAGYSTSLEPQPDEHLHTIVYEGKPTGESKDGQPRGRMFTHGSIVWREPPFAYHWQRSSSAHSGQPETVQVGRVDRVVRLDGQGPDGVNEVHFFVRLDLQSPEGLDYARRLVDGFAIWSSVGGDESIHSSDLELIFPEIDDDEAAASDEDGVLSLLFGGEPELTVFNHYRVSEVSAVSNPALADATVEPTQALIDALAAMGVLTAAAVASHKTGTSDGTWDAGANVKRLADDAGEATLRKVFAWLPDGDVSKSSAKFPHHEVSADGTPGAANMAACSSGIGALHGGRGGTSIPDADRKGVYNHLAAHLKAGGQEPPAFDAGPIVAAGHIIEIPEVPPAWWFDEPVDVSAHGALTVTDEGRIYGYLAPDGIAHRSFPGRRVTVPMGRVDYGRWMGGEAIVAGGGRVVAGPITMECGHLPPEAASAADTRMQHYDNTCAVVAKARVGENRHGVWIAGALEPGVSADQVSRMLACRLSGDWAPHPERPGWREFVAALLVPVPGFPMARTAPSLRVADGALVASAVPVRIVHSDDDVVTVDADGADLRPALERLARSIGRDTDSRMRALHARVHTDQIPTH